MELFLGVVAVLLALVGARLFLVERRLRRIFGNGKDAVVAGTVAAHTETIGKLQKELARIGVTHAPLARRMKTSLQKVSMMRFNPFSDTGGDQSFAIALLDGQNNGIVLSGLYVKSGPMVYAKPIQQGASRYALSREEQEVLEQAIGSANGSV